MLITLYKFSITDTDTGKDKDTTDTISKDIVDVVTDGVETVADTTSDVAEGKGSVDGTTSDNSSSETTLAQTGDKMIYVIGGISALMVVLCGAILYSRKRKSNE